MEGRTLLVAFLAFFYAIFLINTECLMKISSVSKQFLIVWLELEHSSNIKEIDRAKFGLWTATN